MAPPGHRAVGWLVTILVILEGVWSENLAPKFASDGNLRFLRIPENTPVETSVYTLKAEDPEGLPVEYGIQADFLKVNRFTGEVRVSRQIDYESAPSFNVLIIASDGVSETKLSVPIQVIDANDEQPRFTRDIYKQSIDENAPVGTTVMRDLAITDKDTVNSLIEVRCAREKIVDVDALDTCDKFGLKTLAASNLNWTGVLILQQSLDFESQRSYQVPLESFDGNPQNNVTVSVEITVNPVQDAPPRWLSAPNSVINENVPMGHPVTKVIAVDGDEGNPRPIRYEIYSNPGNYFTIDDTTGQISTRRLVDRESGDFNQGFVLLSLRARELIRGPPERLGDDALTTATVTIRVRVEDLNDNPPRFDQSSYTVSIPEDIPTGTALPGLFMTVTDSDSGAGTAYTFTLLNHTREFEVFPGQGQGTTTVSMNVRDTNLINYETGPREYVMTIIAREVGTPELYSSQTTVTVRVTDVNDNLPEFIPPSYVASVREDARRGTPVLTVTAVDNDLTPSLGTDSIRFSLSGTDSNRFQINSITGEVEVSFCATPGTRPCIDYEQLKFYELVVTAKDQNGAGQDVPAKLRVDVLDVNDNQPRFLINNYGSTIMEGETLPVPEVKVQASDRDENSNIRYSVVSQDGTAGLFQIDPVSGFINAVRNVRFNDTQPNTDEIKITVRAFDGVFSNTALVTIIVIDVNDGPPKFIDEIYRASIPETTKGVVTVTSVSAIDVDSTGSITYEISSGDQDKFDINKNTGDITTTPNSTFNFDMQPEYRMLIKARDEGSPQMTGTATVIVTILDRNNRNPYFQPANLRAQVYENVQVGHVVRTISGQDPDKTADLYYYFGTPKRAYSPTGGEVNQTVYNFTNLFTIGERSGIVQTAAKLSRDETSLITYPLVVIDRGAIDQTGTGTLIIDVLDVNDKAPVFKPPWTVGNPVYYQDLDEERPQNTFVRVMVATDPDGAIDRYEMVWNPGQYFAVNRETGEVTINRRLDFDYDKANPQPKTFNFTVRAYDNGLTPLYSDASVVVNLININDNNPRFASPTYSTSIKESGTPGGSKPGDFIIRVQASDLDAGLYGDVYYGLQPTETRFEIDRTSGNITLLANDIDREKISDITFQALAYDSDPADQRTSSVQIYVRIDDINDNPPVFTKPVYERTIPEIFGSSQAILQLSATDKDISDRDNLRYEPANRTGNVMFYIDPTSGFVTPTRTLQGRSGTYEMSVVVKDNGGVSPYLFDTAIMRVIVQAVTNHPPRWVIPPRDNMTIFVLEEQYLGMIVYDVYANDTDSGANAIVEYAFETARSDNETRTKEFRINPITGVIQAQRVFDREERDRYTLVLVARDRGGLKNTIFLRIVIKDVNDHLPRFAPQEYSKSIPEDKPLGSLVLALTATDADQTPSAQTVFYKIIAGNEDEMFLISATTGVITLNKPLDAEKKRSYTLEVMGYNNVSDYSVISKRSQPQNIATVFIIVTDTNDNAPVFTEASYFSCVSTGAALESSIVAVTAVDTDSQSVLSYRMITLNNVIRNYFSVNNRTGVISNRMLMGDFAGQTFTFDVQVTDGRSTANTSVTLFVTSPDDEAMIVLAQPPDEVRTIQNDLERKLAVLLTEHNGGVVVRVCISRIENHIGADVSINTAWSDVYFNGMYMETTRKYTAFTDVDLTTRTQEIINDVASRDELSIFYIREVTAKSAASAESVFLSLPALVVMIIVIILLILALLLCLCCCCCYNPRRHRKDKEKLIGGAAGGYTIEEHRSGQFMSSGGVAHADSSFHQAQGYENKGYVAETSMVQQAVADPVYATVQKKSRTGTMETVERLETQQAMETHEAMEAHEHLESVLREESSQPRTVESHSETTIITEVVPDEEVRGPDVRIITEPITDEEMAAQGVGREFHLVRQDATDTQGIEVEFSDSPGASASFSPGHTTTVHEYREETVRTEM